MHRLFVFFLFISQFGFSQNVKSFDPLRWTGNTGHENLIAKYSGYDFSPVWLVTPNQHVLGIIGNEHQRIRVKLLTVTRDENNPLIYNVTGKSSVMGNICDFTGTMRLTEIKEFAGPETISRNSGSDKSLVKMAGILYGDYEFREDPTQSHVGIFSGKFASIWYLDTLGNMNYNHFYITDGYFNNLFRGTWSSYEGNDERICVWADYDIPVDDSGERALKPRYMPEPRHYRRGWMNYVKAYRDSDKKALLEEEREWWK